MESKTINSIDVFKILDEERRLNYKNITAFAKHLKVSRTRYDKIIETLQNEGTYRGVSFNKVSELLERAGYKLQIKKIEST